MNGYLLLVTIFGNVMLAVMSASFAFKAISGVDRKKNALLSVAMFAAFCPLLLGSRSESELDYLVIAMGVFGTVAAVPWFIQKQFERAEEVADNIAKKVIDISIDKETGTIRPVSSIPGQQMLYFGSTEEEKKEDDWFDQWSDELHRYLLVLRR